MYDDSMLKPYRRDIISKSLFRVFEILIGASLVSFWFSPLPVTNKIALGLIIMLIFVVAVVCCPSYPPGGVEKNG